MNTQVMEMTRGLICTQSIQPRKTFAASDLRSCFEILCPVFYVPQSDVLQISPSFSAPPLLASHRHHHQQQQQRHHKH